MVRATFLQDPLMIRPLRASLMLAAALSLPIPASAPAMPSLFHHGTDIERTPKGPKPPKDAKASPAPAAPQAYRASAAPMTLAPGQWPQSRSDLRADPDTLFGALPNGLRYAIRKQTIPPGQAALRLWVGAGSLEETDQQQGLAHFLEHMAFNGSKAVPEGDMIKILERLGLAFGADTNASTAFSETVFKLDLPKADNETVDTSMMLLREIAGNLTIAPAAVDRERGVVLSEERTRDTPAYRIYKSRLEFLMPGQRLPTRYPIGQVDVLKTTPAGRIADFYRSYYRPERAVLVAVGDFDPAAMEAKIKARFGDWTGTGPAGGDPDLGKVKPRGPQARLVVEPGAPASLQIAWVRPPDLAADTVAKRRRDMIDQLGLQVLNRRLSRMTRSSQPPFLGAGAAKFDQEHGDDVTMIMVNTEAARWRDALSAVEQEERRAVDYGVRQEELDREIVEYRTSLQAAVAGAATRRPAELAGDVVESLADKEVVTSPQDDLALFESAVQGLKAEEVSAALKAVFKGEGPLVFMASPTPIAGGEATLLAALTDSQKVAVTAPAAAVAVAWPYEDFGTPGKVVERREVIDLDTVFVRFANGVRLTVKPTKFRDDEVLVRVNIGDGLLSLPADHQAAGWMSSAFIEGGLRQIAAEDMDKALASKVYGARFTLGEDALVLSGSTRPDDLETQLQVLTAYVAEPGWRPEAFQRLKNSYATLHDQYEATDSGVLQRDLGGLMRRGDRRWTVPSRQEIAAAQPGDLQGQIAAQLAHGPVEVEIVGDTTVDKAIEAVAQTFAALPPRAAPTPVAPAARRLGLPDPAAQPLVLRHKGRADQAIGYVAWPTTDYYVNPQRARDTAVMGEVMSLRLLDELREAQGITYSPSVGYSHSLVWTGWGYVSASVEIPPEKLAKFFTDVDKIAADLRTVPVNADELERAKKPRLDRIEKARVTNQYWLGELAGAQADPRRLDAIRQIIPGTERVSAADVQKAAATWLLPDKEWRLEVRPQDK
jgi:zinc protease